MSFSVNKQLSSLQSYLSQELDVTETVTVPVGYGASLILSDFVVRYLNNNPASNLLVVICGPHELMLQYCKSVEENTDIPHDMIHSYRNRKNLDSNPAGVCITTFHTCTKLDHLDWDRVLAVTDVPRTYERVKTIFGSRVTRLGSQKFYELHRFEPILGE